MTHGPYRTSPLGTVATSVAESEEELDLAQIQSTVTQNIPNSGAETTAVMGTQVFQKGTTVVAQPATNNIRVVDAGYYDITWKAHWDNGSASLTAFSSTLTFNGISSPTPIDHLSYPINVGAGATSYSKTVHRFLAAGTTLGLVAWHTSSLATVGFVAALTVVKLATT